MPEILTENQIRCFLHYGYLPKPSLVDVQGVLDKCKISLNEQKSAEPIDALVEKGAAILDRVFREVASSVGDETVAIPLSGGMDSRAILAGMLDYLPKEKIRTATFGVPGALDYEIGPRVASNAGVRNKPFNLDEVVWDESELIGYAEKLHRPIPLVEGFLFRKALGLFERESIIMSGFMGDPLSGARLPKRESRTWHDACLQFADRNNYSMSQPACPPSGCLPPQLLQNSAALSLDDQLDFFVRQRTFIKPLVLPKGYRHITPFLNPEWVEFMLALPRTLREGQVLYKKILLHAYPDLFSLPLKNLLGLTLRASRPSIVLKKMLNKAHAKGRQYVSSIFSRPSSGLNYIDFEKAYRSKPDLVSIADKSLRDLQRRRIVEHIDIASVWHEHIENRRDNARMISLLVSLEVFLKSKERKRHAR